ncbi:conserved hypothetical protein (plasmid) [Borreliella garinii PBr]|uniref:Uncharacterized protein n=1 Tax=Borreliella garinii PBr TaxID=498743 RepID=B8F111_BORGR|nr:conserved hypothetical protein [Borreliella garinii PBr]
MVNDLENKIKIMKILYNIKNKKLYLVFMLFLLENAHQFFSPII